MAESRRNLHLLLSCEHGGNEVPPAYQSLFGDFAEQLETHRGYDIGALELARRLSAALGAPLVEATLTRLLVDLNRSLHNRRTLFSDVTRALPQKEKDRIVQRYYLPYRRQVRYEIEWLLARHRRVVHIAVHSFTPELKGERRNAEIGLLYDPQRRREADFCRQWQAHLRKLAPAIRVRRNYPYRGVSDALVTTLRRSLPEDSYLGLELEVNQILAQTGGCAWQDLQRIVEQSLADLSGEKAGQK